ncbi:hypothetical protein PRUPE_3G205500 [Prunus persica]|uniref:Uncharacterized protein n=1 Tax=Prunus persica TaxID=3760 RepID=A0A251Q351_PRUPE|nr:hypothetical protein PRUPE_3G205500 [Prunus persica]
MLVQKKMKMKGYGFVLALVLIFSSVAAEIVPQDHESKVDGAEKTVDDCVQYDGLGRRGRCGSSAAYAREEAMPETDSVAKESER